MTNRLQAIETGVAKNRNTNARRTHSMSVSSAKAHWPTPTSKPPLSRKAKRAHTFTTLKGTAVDAKNLATRFASGISLALWQPNADGDLTENELKRAAMKWAESEDAIGANKSTTIDSKKLVFGEPFIGGAKLDKTIGDVAAALQKIAGVTTAQSHTKVRVLALFTHGTADWIGVGGGIDGSAMAALVKKLSPHLTNDVKIILFGCSSARGTTEKKDWVTTTMNDGGADSLCSTIRDALLKEGHTLATVWGHTEVGHTTTNISLREFRAADGKGSVGRSFLKAYGIAWDSKVVDDLRTKMKDAKWTIDATNDAEFIKRAKESLQSWDKALKPVGPYWVWVNLPAKETFDSRNLAEAAPTNATGVGAIIAKAWTAAFTANWEALAAAVAKKAKLSQTKSFGRSFSHHAGAFSVDHPWSHSFPFAVGDTFAIETKRGALGSGAVTSCDSDRVAVNLVLRDVPLRSAVVEAVHTGDGPQNRLRVLADGSAVFDGAATMQSAGNVREITTSNFSLLNLPVERGTLARVDADTATLTVVAAGSSHELRLLRTGSR